MLVLALAAALHHVPPAHRKPRPPKPTPICREDSNHAQG